MLEKTTESQNIVTITGVLNELDIVEGRTADGREFVRGTAFIAVDQEVDGVPVSNIIPVKMFSMKLKKDGGPNKIYERILGYKNEFKSVAIVEDRSEATRVTVSAKVSENSFYDERTNQIRSGYAIDSNFINKAKDADVEGAKFVFSGVVMGKQNEVDTNGEETGRLLVKMGLVGYAGKLNVITLVATGSKKDHIENNWENKETVKVAGLVNMTHEVKQIVDDSGFGDPIVRTKTINKNELFITGGSASGLEEDLSYDATDISEMLEARKADLEALKNKTPKAAPAKSNGGFDVGF